MALEMELFLANLSGWVAFALILAFKFDSKMDKLITLMEQHLEGAKHGGRTYN